MSQLKIKDGSGQWQAVPIGGEGIPVGGVAGQILQKVSSSDYNTAWVSVRPTNEMPAALGTASIGASSRFALSDHVHAMPSCHDLGASPTWDLLWVNAAPTVAFASQSMIVDLTDYDGIMVEITCTTATNLPCNMNLILKNQDNAAFAKNPTSNGLYGRRIQVYDDYINIEQGYANGTAGAANGIPLRIWGVKDIPLTL